MLHAQLIALFYRTIVITHQSFTLWEYGTSNLSCSCDLALTFIQEPDPYSMEMYQICNYEFPMSWLSNIIVW